MPQRKLELDDSIKRTLLQNAIGDQPPASKTIPTINIGGVDYYDAAKYLEGTGKYSKESIDWLRKTQQDYLANEPESRFKSSHLQQLAQSAPAELQGDQNAIWRNLGLHQSRIPIDLTDPRHAFNVSQGYLAGSEPWGNLEHNIGADYQKSEATFGSRFIKPLVIGTGALFGAGALGYALAGAGAGIAGAGGAGAGAGGGAGAGTLGGTIVTSSPVAGLAAGEAAVTGGSVGGGIAATGATGAVSLGDVLSAGTKGVGLINQLTGQQSQGFQDQQPVGGYGGAPPRQTQIGDVPEGSLGSSLIGGVSGPGGPSPLENYELKKLTSALEDRSGSFYEREEEPPDDIVSLLTR